MEVYIARPARILAGDDDLVHVGEHCGLPPMTMTRRVAIANGRALLAAVAALEHRDKAAKPPAPLKRKSPGRQG